MTTYNVTLYQEIKTLEGSTVKISADTPEAALEAAYAIYHEDWTNEWEEDCDQFEVLSTSGVVANEDGQVLWSK